MVFPHELRIGHALGTPDTEPAFVDVSFLLLPLLEPHADQTVYSLNINSLPRDFLNLVYGRPSPISAPFG